MRACKLRQAARVVAAEEPDELVAGAIRRELTAVRATVLDPLAGLILMKRDRPASDQLRAGVLEDTDDLRAM